jgi:hypothetical protein
MLLSCWKILPSWAVAGAVVFGVAVVPGVAVPGVAAPGATVPAASVVAGATVPVVTVDGVDGLAPGLAGAVWATPATLGTTDSCKLLLAN